MSHPLANWQCKCGRGPSIEHPVNGYCSGRIVIEALEARLAEREKEIERLTKDRKAQNAVTDLIASHRDELALRAERYREALEKIADGAGYNADGAEIVIAKAALGELERRDEGDGA